MTELRDPTQRLLPFEGTKEQRRLERCQRLLARLGQPSSKLTTGARMFDFNEATRIAEEANRRATR